MAISITATDLLEARAMYQSGEFNRPKLSESETGALSEGIHNAPFLLPGYNVGDIRHSSAQVEKIPYYERLAAGAATTRGNSAIEDGTTALATVTKQGFREEIKFSVLRSMNNDIPMAVHIATMMEQKARNLRSRIDTAAVASLLAARTQYAAPAQYVDPQFAWDAVNFQHELAIANQDDLFRHIEIMCNMNDMGSNYRMLSNPYVKNALNYINNQGGGNSTNLAYSTAGNNNVAYTKGIANAAGEKHVSYVYREGAFGLTFWVNKLHAMGANNGFQNWSTMTDDKFGFPIELYTEKSKEDTSGAGVTGGELDLTTSIVMYAETSFVAAPDPTGAAVGSDIFKVVQLTT